MQTTINTLQDIINQRAEKRLDKDLSAICEFVHSNTLLTDTSGPEISKDKHPYWIFQKNSSYMRELKTHYLPKYQEEEASRFVAKVDDLQAELEALKVGDMYED